MNDCQYLHGIGVNRSDSQVSETSILDSNTYLIFVYMFLFTACHCDGSHLSVFNLTLISVCTCERELTWNPCDIGVCEDEEPSILQPATTHSTYLVALHLKHGDVSERGWGGGWDYFIKEKDYFPFSQKMLFALN